jgi:hypothetical protein
VNARERDREGWWRRIQPVLNKELGWFGIPVKPKAAQIIERAELPRETKALVQRVVKRTRLRRSEKRDVARELCGHFLDGIESGAEVSELIRLFGDEKAAAKLIRRGKLRNRGIIWKSWIAIRWGALGVVGVFLCAYVIFAVRLALSERVISRDYLAEFNAPALAVPVEERGWTILEGLDLHELRTTWRDSTKYLQEIAVAEPGTVGWRFGAEIVNDYRDELEAIREAAAKPRLAKAVKLTGPVINSSDGFMVWWRLSTTWDVEPAARLLEVDTRRAIHRRDGRTLSANMRAFAGLIRGAAESQLLIDAQFAIWLLAVQRDIIDDLLLRDPGLLSNSELAELAHLLGGVSAEATFSKGLAGERALLRNLIQRLYSDDGSGGGLVVPAALSELQWFLRASRSPPSHSVTATLFGPVASMVMPSRREVEQLADRLFAASARRISTPVSEWQAEPALRELDGIESSWIRKSTYGPILEFLPPSTDLAIIKESATQQNDATLVAIALELYRRRNNEWPNSLGELVPEYLPAVPIDRFSGGPIGYTIVNGMPLLYSVGADHDDDGGRAPAPTENALVPEYRHFAEWASQATKGAALPDGDWILWPPQKD